MLLLLHRAPFGRAILPVRASQMLDAWTVLAPDVPGYGGTGQLAAPGERTPQIEQYAAALRGLLIGLDFRPAVVVGDREGAVIALALAAMVPEVSAK